MLLNMITQFVWYVIVIIYNKPTRILLLHWSNTTKYDCKRCTMLLSHAILRNYVNTVAAMR